MRSLIWFIILAVLAVGVTFLADLNTGYALFVIPPYRVEVSLNVFIISLILSVIALYLLLKLVVGIVSIPFYVRRWREHRRQSDAKKQGYLAMMSLAEGLPERAAREVEKALLHEKNSEAQLVVMLTGAKAAHMRHDWMRRNEYLDKAVRQDKQHTVAVLMLKAEMLLDERDDDTALTTIEEIYKISPKLMAAMRIELRIQQRQENALRVIELTHYLEKRNVLEHILADRIRHEAYIQHAGKFTESKMLRDWWDKLPIPAKYQASLVLIVVQVLKKLEDKISTVEVIEETLQHNWDSVLVEEYGRLKLEGTDLREQLQKTEAWLISHPNDETLLRALGRLCVASSLWGKAQSYFEASLAISASAITHAELGRLLEELGQSEEANYHYRVSLGLSL